MQGLFCANASKALKKPATFNQGRLSAAASAYALAPQITDFLKKSRRCCAPEPVHRVSGSLRRTDPAAAPPPARRSALPEAAATPTMQGLAPDRKSTRLNSRH